MKAALTLLLTLSIAALAADSTEETPVVQEAKSIRWKANVFAGTALLAVAAGIAVICLDGGSSENGRHHHHCHHHGHKHHHHHHRQNDDDG